VSEEPTLLSDEAGRLLSAEPADDLRSKRLRLIEEGRTQPRTAEELAAANRAALLRERAARPALAVEDWRVRRWRETRRPLFASARLVGLEPSQDPGGRVSGWLERTESPTLLLTGPPTGGKSWAATAVGNEAARPGMLVVYWTATAFLDALREEHAESSRPRVFKEAANCDLLILDDLGRERPTPLGEEALPKLIDERYSGQRRTVVTTNLSRSRRAAAAALADHLGRPVEDDDPRVAPGMEELYGYVTTSRLLAGAVRVTLPARPESRRELDQA
jgi:hypothetical protein